MTARSRRVQLVQPLLLKHMLQLQLLLLLEQLLLLVGAGLLRQPAGRVGPQAVPAAHITHGTHHNREELHGGARVVHN